METSKDYSWNQNELEEFRFQVLKERHLKCKTDDMFLLCFLRARKYDKERALKLLKNYYASRKKYSEVFKDLRPSAMETFLQMNIMCFKTLESGQVLGLGRASHWDATKATVIDVIRGVFLLGEFQMKYHPIQVNGLYILIDVKTLSWRHLVQFTPRVLSLILSFFVQTVPVSYKGIHIVNTNKYVQAIVTMLRPFIPYKIKHRIHLHRSNMEDLHKVINPKYLPEEFGGQLPFDASETNRILRENEEYFIENEKIWSEEENT